MNIKRLYLTTFLFAVFLNLSFISAQSNVSIVEIKKSLICSCECNMTIEACQGSMSCGTAENLTDEIKILVQEGLDSKQILASFINRYGEQILAAPTKKGFNILAWSLPYIVTILVGIIIIFLLRQWVSKSQGTKILSKSNSTEQKDSEYEKKLDDVLRRLD